MRNTLATPVFVVFALTLAACTTSQPPTPSRIIDTHIHLYDTSRPEGVPWPGKGDTVLYKPHLPADFAPIAKAHGVTDIIIVEASDRLEDNQWVLELVKTHPQYIGLVGNLRPGTDDFAKHLDRFTQDNRFVGIRPRFDTPIALTDDRVIADLAKLADKGLSLDMLIHKDTLKQIDIVAQRVPKLRIVINHLAGVKVDGQTPDPAWVAQLKACAKHPNVYCKISGLDQQAGSRPAPTDLAHYKPVLDAIYDAFGADRLIYGSNWPVTNLGSDYGTHLKLVLAYIQPKGKDVVEKVFWKNATKAYGL